MTRLGSLLAALALLVSCESRERREQREAVERFRQNDAGIEARNGARREAIERAADRVRVSDSAGVRGCQHIKRLEVSETDELTDAYGANRDALLQSRAAQLGADAIVLTIPPQYEGRIAIGEAYRCGSTPKPGTPAPFH